MTKFTSEDKMNAIIQYQDKSKSINDIAKSPGTNHELVGIWIKLEYQGISVFEKGRQSMTKKNLSDESTFKISSTPTKYILLLNKKFESSR
ncbi:hypothetical protein [Bacillus cereus]|nr:hypothetical protein [Bacillus cereus]HDR3914695.1 hypothetical protein [Bacillus cereus]HDV7172764.1 hypothetical protein [Bacillus cereus]